MYVQFILNEAQTFIVTKHALDCSCVTHHCGRRYIVIHQRALLYSYAQMHRGGTMGGLNPPLGKLAPPPRQGIRDLLSEFKTEL